MDASPFIPFIKELARESAQVIMPHFGNLELSVDAKGDDTPVTVADRGAEARMRELIAKRFPEHGILGEEYGNENIEAEYVWILDPIDGTKSFVAGVPLFTTLIGLLHRGEPVLGAIHDVAGQRLCIGDNKQAWLNDSPVRVRDNTLERALLLTSDPYAVGEFQDEAGWMRLVRATHIHRSWGDGFGYLQVASGWADIMCDPVLEPWDILPVVPVLRGAGAALSQWDGKPLCFEPQACSRSLVAAHPSLHAEVLARLASKPC